MKFGRKKRHLSELTSKKTVQEPSLVAPSLQEIRQKPNLNAKLSALAPSGYLFAHNLRGARAESVRTTYPKAWVEKYNRNLYAAVDPVVQFTLLREGAARWSEIGSYQIPIATSMLMSNAEIYGLKYGVIIVGKSKTTGHKSALSVSRPDREFLDEEIEFAKELFETALPKRRRVNELSQRQLNGLCLARDGVTMKEIGDQIGVSVETVKKDMQQARILLNARNLTHAVSIAITCGHIPGTCDTFW